MRKTEAQQVSNLPKGPRRTSVVNGRLEVTEPYALSPVLSTAAAAVGFPVCSESKNPWGVDDRADPGIRKGYGETEGKEVCGITYTYSQFYV